MCHLKYTTSTLRLFSRSLQLGIKSDWEQVTRW